MDTWRPHSLISAEDLSFHSSTPSRASRVDFHEHRPDHREEATAPLSSVRAPEALLSLPALPKLEARGLTRAPKEWLDFERPLRLGIANRNPAPGAPTHLSSFAPSLTHLIAVIREELENNLNRLLALNRSRRESLLQYLEWVAGESVLSSGDEADARLLRWLSGPRTTVQEASLRFFLEEIALVYLGQAILLKAWSDRHLRRWSRDDLKQVNWALSSTLKPMLPLDREGWQITRPNLYSWYNPGADIQAEVWRTMDAWRITDEGPSLLSDLLLHAQRLDGSLRPRVREASYDPRFFEILWKRLPSLGLDLSHETGPLKRKRMVFSPTLRDGAMIRTGPTHVNWIGLEQHPFLLLVTELTQLWWGPAAPPVWTQGNGLEVFTRDQLSLSLGSPKPTLLSRITEMEACDLSIVLEEKAVRSTQRSPEAHRFRESIDQFPYFKKIKSAATTIGDIQACVAIQKLRPGGMFCWAREEPLTSADGAEVLNFLLERGKLLAEWNFSNVEHTLPSARTLFPRYLYLFQREPALQIRHQHRPKRITIQGQIRSHVEVQVLLQDAFEAYQTGAPATRESWKLHAWTSPVPQKEWAERWPDPSENSVLESIDDLRSISLPLASVSTVRPTPPGDPAKNHQWTLPMRQKGLYLRALDGADGERRLAVEYLPNASPGSPAVAHGNGYLVLVPDESWISPLKAYLECEHVRTWLDHHAERRGNRWVLNEQVIKLLPVPRNLLCALGANLEEIIGNGNPGSGGASFATPLPGEWERLASEVPYTPRKVLDKVAQLSNDHPDDRRIRATLFVRTARAIEHLVSTQNRLLNLVSPEGQIRWRQLFQILPPHEFHMVSTHAEMRLSGSLPLNQPILKFERVKYPMPGILFLTESGFQLHIGSENPRLLEMIWDQLEGVQHPTWSELVQYLRLPRSLEWIEQTAGELLKSHAEQTSRWKELLNLLQSCSRF